MFFPCADGIVSVGLTHWIQSISKCQDFLEADMLYSAYIKNITQPQIRDIFLVSEEPKQRLHGEKNLFATSESLVLIS